MIPFLGKTKTGNATRNEKKRLKSPPRILRQIQKEVKMAKHTEGKMEIKMLKPIAPRKTTDLKKTTKQKATRNDILYVCATESVDLALLVDCSSSTVALVCKIF